MDGYNDNIHQQQIDKLQQLFPEAVTEGKIDWQKLQATLGKAVDLGERYGLGWKGKSDVFATIQEKTVQTLHPDQANSVDWDTTGNMFIEGDNLAALKILHKAYYGKVKIIYIDPPYNTGNDFIYNDDFKQTRRSYEAEAGITDDEGNVVRYDGLRTNTGGHKHSNWLNMMYPRLFLARNLLRQDGVIFVSIDDNEVHNLRLMMNEIFGEENFISTISWRRKKEIANDTKGIATQVEYILVYARSSETELAKKPLDQKYIENSYKYSDSKGIWRPVPLTIDMGHKGGGYDYEITTPKGSIVNRKWRMPKSTYENMLKNNELFFGKNEDGIPQRKKYLDSDSGTFYSNIWYDLDTNKTGKKEIADLFGFEVFDTVKPTGLIREMLNAVSDKDVIVLDFFSGSGTTAHAVMQLNAEDGGNRKWICVQLGERTDEKSDAFKAGYHTIADIARERIRRAGVKIRADQADKLASRNVSLDLGFRAYRVSDSNFKQWNELVSDPEEIRQQALANLDPLEEGATDDDLLTELLLKRGISPLAQIEQHDGFCFIPSEKLAVCLAHSMTEELFATILAAKPSSIILLDRACGGDVNLKVNLLRQAERQGVEVEVV